MPNCRGMVQGGTEVRSKRGAWIQDGGAHWSATGGGESGHCGGACWDYGAPLAHHRLPKRVIRSALARPSGCPAPGEGVTVAVDTGGQLLQRRRPLGAHVGTSRLASVWRIRYSLNARFRLPCGHAEAPAHAGQRPQRERQATLCRPCPVMDRVGGLATEPSPEHAGRPQFRRLRAKRSMSSPPRRCQGARRRSMRSASGSRRRALGRPKLRGGGRSDRAPSYSMTSFAASSNAWGTVMPSALAARLSTISSSLEACSNGISAGFCPLRM